MTHNEIIAHARGSKGNLFMMAVLAGLISACQTTQQAPAPVIDTFVSPAVPTVAPVALNDVKWKVYNTADLEKLVADLKAKGDKNFVLIAVTPQGYKNLSTNIAELERYIREQKKVTVFLKKTLDDRAKPRS